MKLEPRCYKIAEKRLQTTEVMIKIGNMVNAVNALSEKKGRSMLRPYSLDTCYLRVQYLPHLPRQLNWQERFLKVGGSGVKDAVVDDGVAGIAGHI